MKNSNNNKKVVLKTITEKTFLEKVKSYLDKNKIQVEDEKSTLIRNKKNAKPISELKILGFYYQRFFPEQGRQKVCCQQSINDMLNVLKIYVKNNAKKKE